MRNLSRESAQTDQDLNFTVTAEAPTSPDVIRDLSDQQKQEYAEKFSITLGKILSTFSEATSPAQQPVPHEKAFAENSSWIVLMAGMVRSPGIQLQRIVSRYESSPKATEDQEAFLNDATKVLSGMFNGADTAYVLQALDEIHVEVEKLNPTTIKNRDMVASAILRAFSGV